MQDLESYEKSREELAFVKAITQGLMDIQQGDTISLAEVKKKLESPATKLTPKIRCKQQPH